MLFLYSVLAQYMIWKQPTVTPAFDRGLMLAVLSQFSSITFCLDFGWIPSLIVTLLV